MTGLDELKQLIERVVEEQKPRECSCGTANPVLPCHRFPPNQHTYVHQVEPSLAQNQSGPAANVHRSSQ